MKTILLPMCLFCGAIQNPIEDYMKTEYHLQGVQGYVTQIFRIDADVNNDDKQDCLFSDDLQYDPFLAWNEENPEDKQYIWNVYISNDDGGYEKCWGLKTFSCSEVYTGTIPEYSATKLFFLGSDKNTVYLNALVCDKKGLRHELVKEFEKNPDTNALDVDGTFWEGFFKNNKATIVSIPVTPYLVKTTEGDGDSETERRSEDVGATDFSDDPRTANNIKNTNKSFVVDEGAEIQKSLKAGEKSVENAVPKETDANYSEDGVKETEEKSGGSTRYLLFCSGCVFVCLALIVVCWRYRRMRRTVH